MGLLIWFSLLWFLGGWLFGGYLDRFFGGLDFGGAAVCCGFLVGLSCFLWGGGDLCFLASFGSVIWVRVGCFGCIFGGVFEGRDLTKLLYLNLVLCWSEMLSMLRILCVPSIFFGTSFHLTFNPFLHSMSHWLMPTYYVSCLFVSVSVGTKTYSSTMHVHNCESSIYTYD